LAAGLFLVVAAGWAPADYLADAARARTEGEFSRAWEILVPHAQRGDANALLALGDLMLHSDLPDARERAVRFYQAAATAGSGEADMRLRRMQNDEAAAKLEIPEGMTYQEFLVKNRPSSPAQVQALISRPYEGRPEDFPASLRQQAEAPTSSRVHVIILLDAATPLTDQVVKLQEQLRQMKPGEISFEWIAPVKSLALRGGTAPKELQLDPTGQAQRYFRASRLPVAVLLVKGPGGDTQQRLIPLGELENAAKRALQ
jgi:hypothetical protein